MTVCATHFTLTDLGYHGGPWIAASREKCHRMHLFFSNEVVEVEHHWIPFTAIDAQVSE
jgi:hypothetical protein